MLSWFTPHHWLKSWEVGLAGLLLAAGQWLPRSLHLASLADCALWFGVIVLGTGLLRDLWALVVTRSARGEQEVAMCAESIVGAAAVAGGLTLTVVAFLAPGLVPGSTTLLALTTPCVVVGLAAALIFSAWVHDLVFVKRSGRFRLERHREHGSFVVHLFRGQAKACALGPRAPKDQQV